MLLLPTDSPSNASGPSQLFALLWSKEQFYDLSEKPKNAAIKFWTTARVGLKKVPNREDSDSSRRWNALYQSINQAAGDIVVITGDFSAGIHRLAQYSELAEHVKKPIYFVLGNHDRYGTTFANAEGRPYQGLLQKEAICQGLERPSSKGRSHLWLV